jgi:hypothetical protein
MLLGTSQNARIGTTSIRNAPGTIALFIILSASAAARRNRSSLLVMSIPYVISMTSDPAKLRQGTENEIYDKATCGNTHNSV